LKIAVREQVHKLIQRILRCSDGGDSSRRRSEAGRYCICSDRGVGDRGLVRVKVEQVLRLLSGNDGLERFLCGSICLFETARNDQPLV
jgi:hypothetical protein